MMLHTKYQGSKALWFQTKRFFPIKAYVNNVNPGLGHFWPQGHNLNKLGYILNIKALGLMVSDKKIFPCFSLY